VKLLHVTTVPQSLRLLTGQAGYMRSRGIDTSAVSSPGDALQAHSASEAVPVCAVAMSRRITPLADLTALVRLWRHLRKIRPEIVHSHTPKAGLLGMLAAWIARVPLRVYHIRGLPLVTKTGWKRRLLCWTERIACRLSHQVLCVSSSVAEVAVEEGLCARGKIKVLAAGSGNGVEARERFRPDRLSASAALRIRAANNIPPEAPVIGFIGRIVRDKGLVELAEAWQMLREEFPTLHLLIVGRFESEDPLPAKVERLLRDGDRIHLAGYVAETPPFHAAMDLLVLPTYREGFPNVLLEAAAMGLPVVATRVPGCVDAVEHGVTGTLVPAADAQSLGEAIRVYLRDPFLRRKHGQAARTRVLRDFQPRHIWEALYREYLRLLRERGLAVPARDPETEVRRKVA